MFYEELSPCLYVSDSSFGPEAEKLKAVGWLAWGHPYTRRPRQLPETPLASYSDCLKILGSPFFLWEATSANSVLMQASQSRLKDTKGLTRIWKRITGAIESSVMG